MSSTGLYRGLIFRLRSGLFFALLNVTYWSDIKSKNLLKSFFVVKMGMIALAEVGDVT